MQVRIYAIVLPTGKYDKSGVELEVLLNLYTTSTGANDDLWRFPGAKIKKMIATPNGTTNV